MNRKIFKPFLKSEILHITRITKILEKGKVIRFKVIVASGDSRNVIGLGIGKDVNLATAKKKAIESSYKNLITIKHFFDCNKEKTVPHGFLIKLKKSLILFKPNVRRTGIRAGKLFYVLAKLAGFNQLLVKKIKSKNIVNNIYIFFEFLKKLNSIAD